MRIIKEGKIPNPEIRKTCPYCGCEFAFHPSEAHFDQRDGTSIKCPTCGKWLNV